MGFCRGERSDSRSLDSSKDKWGCTGKAQGGGQWMENRQQVRVSGILGEQLYGIAEGNPGGNQTPGWRISPKLNSILAQTGFSKVREKPRAGLVDQSAHRSQKIVWSEDSLGVDTLWLQNFNFR